MRVFARTYRLKRRRRGGGWVGTVTHQCTLAVRYTRYNLAARGKLLDTVRAIATFFNRFRVSSMHLGNKKLKFRINLTAVERFISEQFNR